MEKKELNLVAKQNFQNRAASRLVFELNKYEDLQFYLMVGERQMNGKSMLGVLSSGIKKGEDFRLVIVGDRAAEVEEEVLKAIEDFC